MKKTISVTFDTNCFTKLFSKNAQYNIILDAIKNSQIIPFMSATIFTIENVRKKDNREEYFDNFKPRVEISFIENENIIEKSITEGTCPKELDKYSLRLLQNTLPLGFKLLNFPRVGMPKLQEKHYAKDSKYSLEERQNRSFKCAKHIEKNLGAGKAVKENHAEWADADSVSAHYGYGIDFFCTDDRAKNDGEISVLSKGNRDSLKEKFDINFISLDDLTNLLTNQNS